MIPLKDAQAERFVNSTRAELRQYAIELGLEPGDRDNAEKLKKMVFAALGLPMDLGGAASARPQVKTDGNIIFPSYNLSPNGLWGGRRHRLSLPRPDGAKKAQAEGFAWNGKHTYYIPYDEVVDVPEPIYQLIVTNKRRRPITVQVPTGDGGVEHTTSWEFDDNAINYRGVDKATEDRAGSLMEWYQSRGSAWFDALTYRQMQLICQKLEIPQQQDMGKGVPPRVFNETELRSRMLEFFFGYADAIVEPNEKIAA